MLIAEFTLNIFHIVYTFFFLAIVIFVRINLPLFSTVVPAINTSTPTRPVDNVVIAPKGLQDRNTNITAGTTVENKGKLILTEIFPTVQKHDIC